MQTQQPAPSPVYTASEQERTWALMTHLSTFSGYVIPFGNVLGPLIIWLIKREQMPLVDQHGKEALNFQISVLIYALISIALICAFIGWFLIIPLIVFQLVVTIIATISASRGELYRYPLCIRFIR